MAFLENAEFSFVSVLYSPSEIRRQLGSLCSNAGIGKAGLFPGPAGPLGLRGGLLREEGAVPAGPPLPGGGRAGAPSSGWLKPTETIGRSDSVNLQNLDP